MSTKHSVCAYCALPCNPTRDHCQPQHLGGRLHNHRGQNWLPACARCNGLKGALPWRWWLRALPLHDERPAKVQGPNLEALHAWLQTKPAATPGLQWIRDEVVAEIAKRDRDPKSRLCPACRW